MKKLRVWWIPQVGASKTFYIPVESPEEGKKVMDMLAAYDMFQLQENIKPDFANAGGLQMFDETESEWTDWYLEDDEEFYEDLDDYCDQCSQAHELEWYREQVMGQIDYEKILMKDRTRWN